MKSTDRLLVAVPAYNEARTLAQTILGIKTVQKSAPFDFDVLIIDDGSSDETHIIAATHQIEAIRHERNRGYGATLMAAFSYAIHKGYEYVLTMDADGQHPAECIMALFSRRQTAEVVSGSRYLPESPRLHPPRARGFNQYLTSLLNEMLCLSLTDVGCGMKCIATDWMKEVSFRETRYCFPIEFWVRCSEQAVRICEAPVPMIYLDSDRTLQAKFGSLELAFDNAIYAFVRSLLHLPDEYSSDWGRRPAAYCLDLESRRCICARIRRHLLAVPSSEFSVQIALNNVCMFGDAAQQDRASPQ